MCGSRTAPPRFLPLASLEVAPAFSLHRDGGRSTGVGGGAGGAAQEGLTPVCSIKEIFILPCGGGFHWNEKFPHAVFIKRCPHEAERKGGGGERNSSEQESESEHTL